MSVYTNKFLTGGAAGSIENGNIFVIEPDDRYVGGYHLTVDFFNREQINNEFSTFLEDIGVYTTTSSDTTTWDQNGNWTGPVDASVLSAGVDAQEFYISPDPEIEGIAIVVENGSYYAKEGVDNYSPIRFIAEVDQAR